MYKSLFYAIMLAVAVCAGACKGQQRITNKTVINTANSRSALNWEGTYLGTVPCADCPGINVELSLNSDLTYTMTRIYQDRQGIFVNSGLFEWNDEGSEIKLNTGSNDGGFQNFRVREGMLVLLTPTGETVTGNNADAYLLHKFESDAENLTVTDTYWILTELNGKPVNYPENSDAAFIFMNSEGRISGNLGCNLFSGSFALQDGNRISFTQLVNTQKMCIDMSIETEMVRVLQNADNYNVNNKQLILNRARMAPLARFERVFIKQ